MVAEAISVLLVEDNEDHAELVMRSLGEHHLVKQIFHLTDGQSALDYLLRRENYASPEQSPRPDLILLDLRLPRMDGFEVLKTLKESETLRHIPIIVLTTSEAERDVARAYEYHANSYIVKPVGFEQFRGLMDDLSVYWLTRNTYLQL